MLRAVATTSLSFSLILNKLPAVEKKTMNLWVTNLTFEAKMGDFEKSVLQDTCTKKIHAAYYCRKF